MEQIKLIWNTMRRESAFVFTTNFLLVMLLYSLCRLFFYLVNIELYPDLTFAHIMTLSGGGLRFDLTALLYLNLPYMLLMLIPFTFRSNDKYQKVTKYFYFIPNLLGIFANCADVVYYQFTNRRTTFSFFSEFSNDNNLGKILLTSLYQYWYVTLFFLVLAFVLFKLYYYPKKGLTRHSKSVLYYLVNTAVLCVFIYFSVIGIRGGFGYFTRPIAMSNANQYINKPAETAIVLNTPFCILRTVSKQSYKNPEYFSSEETMSRFFTPLKEPHTDSAFQPMNVVVIIMESFGKEYTGFFNKDLDNGTYQGYTPFLDSLLSEGYTFDYSYSNGRKSIDAMPSVLSSIPMIVEPYILTPYSVNTISSVASLLGEKGYYSAFFHGAPNGSMGFQAYAKAAGFKDYFGMDDYPDKDDFDGTWAIWDEPFFQFFAQKMGEFKQPFVTSIFSASSHHPFKVPEKYEGQFPKGTQPIHQTVGYSDLALRRFFETMSKYDWYDNTLFVFTADHTNQVAHEVYATDAGRYEVPILFYQHNKPTIKNRSKQPAQQIDIMPSILSYLNYDRPYVAFGQDLFSDDSSKIVINYNAPFYQMFTDSLMMVFDGTSVKSVYDYRNDRMLLNNVADNSERQKNMENTLKAVIQQYMQRMIDDKLVP